MKKISVKPLRLFRFNSVFMTTLVSMLVLCLVLCLLFSILFTNAIVDNTAENRAQTTVTYLNSVADNVDFLVSNVHQTLTQIALNGGVYSFAMSKELNESSISAASMTLSSNSDNNPLIDRAFIYVSSIDCVATSAFRYGALADSVYCDMVELFESGSLNSISIEGSGRISSIFYFGGDIYLARKFPLSNDKALATIYCAVDKNAFYNCVTDDNTNATIWVFDQFNNQIFSSVANYPAEAVETLGILEQTGETSIEYDEYAAFLKVSDETGWKYLYVVDQSSLRPGGWDIIGAMFPIILIVLLLAVISSVIIARILYKPFLKLLDVMENHDLFPSSTPDSTSAYKNEFTYLTYTLSEVAERQEKLSQILHDTVSDVISRFFTNVINGVPMSYSTAKEVLASTQSPFHTNAPYMVCVIVRESGAFDNRDAGVKAFLSAMGKHCIEMYDSGGERSRILMADGELQLVIMFPQDISILQIKKFTGNLETYVCNLGESMHFPVKFAAGQMYHSILDLSFSYKDALAALADGDSVIELPAPEPESAGSETQSGEEPITIRGPKISLAPKAQQLLNLCLAGDSDGAQILYERVIDDICHSPQELSEQAKCCRIFISSFLDKMVKLEYINLSSLPDDLFSFIKSSDEFASSEELLDTVIGVCSRIVTELGGLLKKQQNRYILAAKDFIGKHFHDYDLSLTSIAEAINANPSYLSKLFKSNLGVYFTDYLNNFRIDHSLTLLKDTDDSVKDIAAACGFNSAQNYIRVFKKRLNMTPGAYRKAARLDGKSD